MATTTTGESPTLYGFRVRREALATLNVAVAGLYGEIVRAMPVGVGGRLQRSWVFSPATPNNPQAAIGTSSSYFLPVEMGRRPGKGVSREGQESIELWARRKLRLSPQESRSFAYLLSQKYKREGRKASGLIGLSTPGSLPSGALSPTVDPVPGSILARGFATIAASTRIS